MNLETVIKEPSKENQMSRLNVKVNTTKQSELSRSKSFMKNLSKSFFDNVPTNMYSTIKQKLLENLISKKIEKPRKMKIKEFENHIRKDIESINQMVRSSATHLRRVSLDPQANQEALVEKLNEAIVLGALAGTSNLGNQISDFFNKNELERLGSSFIEISKLNHLIYFNFLKIIKEKNQKSDSEKEKNGMSSKELQWKMYARTLEKELKEIHNIRIQSKLKKEIVSNLDYYSFSSKYWLCNP